MGFPYGETVEFVTAGTTEDEYGNEVSDWSTPTTVLTLDHVGVEPRPSSEVTVDARNAVTSGFTLYFLGEIVDVDPSWRAVVRGEQWQVLGEDAGWVNPFTSWQAGTVVQVGRTDG